MFATKRSINGNLLNYVVFSFGVLLTVLFWGTYSLYAQETGTSRKVAPVDPKIYNAYVGQYELAPGFILTISKENNSLFAQATGQPKVEIFPESESNFFYKMVDAQITFVKNDAGKVVQLILHQNGRDIPGKKISDSVPQERHAVKVDPKIYDAYVGQYELTPNLILTITKENDRLYAQATGQGKAEIFPESPVDFYYTTVDAQITFIKNDGGVIKELVLHQRGVRVFFEV